MKKEDKELLLIDLSTRLRYGVICKSQKFKKRELIGIDDTGCIFKFKGENGETEYGVLDPEEWKVMPYLRPMSSITEEESKEYRMFIDYSYNDFTSESTPCIYVDKINDYLDWLNKKMFDHRGLIEKNLALRALTGMYGGI